jgi:hypothetical protein
MEAILLAVRMVMKHKLIALKKSTVTKIALKKATKKSSVRDLMIGTRGGAIDETTAGIITTDMVTAVTGTRGTGGIGIEAGEVRGIGVGTVVVTITATEATEAETEIGIEIGTAIGTEIGTEIIAGLGTEVARGREIGRAGVDEIGVTVEIVDIEIGIEAGTGALTAEVVGCKV